VNDRIASLERGGFIEPRLLTGSHPQKTWEIILISAGRECRLISAEMNMLFEFLRPIENPAKTM
jgi:hypothetical protein